MQLKNDFKHIHGMWPKTARFANHAQCMESVRTSFVIKKKIFTPSKRLILCQQGIQSLNIEHKKYEAFLEKFRSKSNPKTEEALPISRVSVTGSTPSVSRPMTNASMRLWQSALKTLRERSIDKPTQVKPEAESNFLDMS